MRTKEAIEHCNRFMHKDARCLYTDGGAAFGSVEEHFKCRNAVMKTYPQGHFPIFEGYNHMQYQIRDRRSLQACWPPSWNKATCQYFHLSENEEFA